MAGHVGQARCRRLELLEPAPRLAQRRVEQHARRKVAAFVGRQQRHESRNGMVHADSRLIPVVLVDRLENLVVVLNQGGNRMASERPNGIPAVISQVVDDQVEIVRQQRPEGNIQINGEAVAVAQNEPRACGISMTPQRNHGVVVHAHVVRGMRLGYLPSGFGSHRHVSNSSGCSCSTRHTTPRLLWKPT